METCRSYFSGVSFRDIVGSSLDLEVTMSFHGTRGVLFQPIRVWHTIYSMVEFIQFMENPNTIVYARDFKQISYGSPF